MSRTNFTSRKAPEITYRRKTFEDEKTLKRKIGVLLALTIGLLLLVFFFGIPFVRFVGLLGQRLAPDETLNQTLATPPITPRLDYIPNFTNKNKIEVKGVSDPKVTINLTVNDKEALQAQTDTNGLFEFLNVSLREGSNNLKITAKRGDVSSGEVSASVVFDKKVPNLEVTEPADNAFYPKETLTIKVTGKTEGDAIVNINDFQAIVDHEGNFTFDFPVTGGEQKVKITASDIAGNQKTIEKTFRVDADPTASSSSSPSP